MTLRLVVWLLLAIGACSKKSAPTDPQDHPTQADRAASLRSHLLAANEFNGWVANRNADGSPGGLGDSLLFSGLALGVLSCPDGQAIWDAIKASQDLRGGYFVRYEPLADQYRGNEVSRDGITGLVFGLIRRFDACPDDRIDITARWGRFRDLVRGATTLYPGDIQAIQTPGFGTFMALADSRLLASPLPSSGKMFVWEFQGLFSVSDVIEHQAPCYPVHLATIQGYLFGDLVSQSFKQEFCATTKDSGLMLTSWYCGASLEAVESWLETFPLNKISYAHQRCLWENEVFSGESPSLDWLVLETISR